MRLSKESQNPHYYTHKNSSGRFPVFEPLRDVLQRLLLHRLDRRVRVRVRRRQGRAVTVKPLRGRERLARRAREARPARGLRRLSPRVTCIVPRQTMKEGKRPPAQRNGDHESANERKTRREKRENRERELRNSIGLMKRKKN